MSLACALATAITGHDGYGGENGEVEDDPLYDEHYRIETICAKVIIAYIEGE